MNRIRQSFLWLLLPFVVAVAAPAQTTAVTAPSGSITMGGSPISTGVVVAVPVDVNGHPIAVTKSGGGLNLPGSAANPVGYSCTISAGGIASCSVPDEQTSSPSGFRYNVTITDTSTTDPGAGDSFTLFQVSGITGATYNLSDYTSTAAVPTAAAFTYTYGSSVPTGACAMPAFYADTSTNALYQCVDAAWVAVSGSSGASSFSQLTGTAALTQLPGSGVTTVNGQPCTLGASCTNTSAQLQSAIGTGVYDIAGAAANVGHMRQSFTVGATGVTGNELVKFDSSGNVIPVGVEDSSALGIAETTVAANGSVVVDLFGGTFSCVTDNTATANDLITIGTGTAGTCRDTGITFSDALPMNYAKIGRFLSSAAAGAVASVFLYGVGHQGTQAPSSFGSSITAYGDSITCGYTLTDGTCPGSYPSFPSPHAYPGLVGADLGAPVANHGISADQACDVFTRQVSVAGDNPSLGNGPMYLTQIGTNDMSVKGVGAYEATFNLCDRAYLAWLAVPSQFKVLATSSAITKTGTTTLVAGLGQFQMLRTSAQNDSMSVPLNLNVAGTVYMYYLIVDGNVGTWSYSIGGISGTGATETTTPIATQNGSTTSLGLLRIPNVPAGAQTLVLTQTSTAANGFAFFGAAALPNLPIGSRPVVVVGDVPNAESSGGYASAITEYSSDISANVASLDGDGLDVRFISSHQYMLGGTSEMNNTLHPNVLGQRELAYAFEQGLHGQHVTPAPATPVTTYVATSFTEGAAGALLNGTKPATSLTGASWVDAATGGWTYVSGGGITSGSTANDFANINIGIPTNYTISGVISNPSNLINYQIIFNYENSTNYAVINLGATNSYAVYTLVAGTTTQQGATVICGMNPMSGPFSVNSYGTALTLNFNGCTANITMTAPVAAGTSVGFNNSAGGTGVTISSFNVTTVAPSNCSSAGSPAYCGAAPNGSVVVAAGATSVVVNTTAVTANSQIQTTFDSSLGAKLGVTCNTTASLPSVTARTPGSSFTLTTTAPTANPACFSYSIIN